jgi:hypothetical protein
VATSDYEAAILQAEREFREATTADDIRQAWKKHFSVLGHRTLGRLLLGRPAEELLSRRDERTESD